MIQEVKIPEETHTVCYNHPDRETMLRCNRCNRPICTACAVLTPTGYRCKECVRGQLKVFDTARTTDYVLAFIVAGVLSFFGSLLASFLGFFTIFIAPVAGVVIAEAVRLVVQKRRSKLLFQIATGAAVVGGLPVLLSALLGSILFLGSRGALTGLVGLLWPGLYLVLIVPTVYYRLSGISIR
jgi:hypothetical protein